MIKKVWESEPDFLKGYDLEKNYILLILRNEALLNLCGYVGCFPDSNNYGKTDEELYSSCHGGITYCGRLDVQLENIWWIGFHCGNYRDFIPGIHAYSYSSRTGIYRDINFVKENIKILANDLFLNEGEKIV